MGEAETVTESETSWLDNPKVRKILERHLDETDYRIYKGKNYISKRELFVDHRENASLN